MSGFSEFLEVALRMGTGGEASGFRCIPVFVPEGDHQENLFDTALELLTRCYRFHILDVRQVSFDDAIDSFPLNWPVLVDKWPSEERRVSLPETEKRLLVVCGEVSHDLFWKNLCKDGLLYAGGVLPPSVHPSHRCIVVPDTACVAGLIKADHFYKNFPLTYFGPIGTFDSIKLADTPEGMWYRGLLEEALVERAGKPIAVDASVVVKMCRTDWKSAQAAMQLLAQQMNEDLQGKPVSEAEDIAGNQRLILGTLLLSYCTARHLEDGIPLGTVPQELRWILDTYPIILECTRFVSEYNSRKA